MKKLEKKQIPQFAALCILSGGLFGYFVIRMVSPSPVSAGTLSKPATESAKSAVSTPSAADATAPPAKPGAAASTAGAGSTAVTPATTESPEAAIPPPTPGMRDPFLISAIDPKAPAAAVTPPAVPAPPPPTRIASLPVIRPLPIPEAAAAPSGLSNFSVKPGEETQALPSAPVAPPTPAWSVTGVLQGETDKVAILRNGDARQIVRTGDFLDGLYRVIDVTRTEVVLRHGATFYHLTLGAPSAAPAGIPPAPAAPKPAAPVAPGPKDAAFVPAQQPRRPLLALAHASRSFIKMASSFLAHAAKTPPGSSHIRVTDTTHVAMRFLDDHSPAIGAVLYQTGLRSQARAEWQRIQAMDDVDDADKAKRLLYRNP